MWEQVRHGGFERVGGWTLWIPLHQVKGEGREPPPPFPLTVTASHDPAASVLFRDGVLCSISVSTTTSCVCAGSEGSKALSVVPGGFFNRAASSPRDSRGASNTEADVDRVRSCCLEDGGGWGLATC